MSEFAGLLRSRIEIWERSGERLPTGVTTDSWTLVAKCLARIEPEGVGATAEGMALSAMPRFRLLLRAREDLRIDQRIHWQERKLHIRQIVADPSLPDRLSLRCEEIRQ